ncbi:MAG: tRNA threonylcarbamoyladenosine dehydratase [Lachnospiraceae bacterium]|nr:tRNA threonylcarbamoyladenosine dehydratase [Lachnospiraceae bacterium]
MPEQFQRTRLLLGEAAMERLSGAHVAVFGIGGVGGYVVEALARSGVGRFTLVDNDTVALSNLNRQIIATMDTVGRPKTEVMRERILSINPDAEIICYPMFYLPEHADEIDFSGFDYIVDAIDTVTAKISLVMQAKEAGVPIISSMGTGNKTDPTGLKIADIYETSVCPLAKVMRRELRKRGIERLKVVYSEEEPITPLADDDAHRQAQQNVSAPAQLNVSEPAQQAQKGGGASAKRQRPVPGSCAFVPPVAGLILASEVIKDLSEGPERKGAV